MRFGAGASGRLEALAAEWAGRGVQVVAIAPGAFDTDAQSGGTGGRQAAPGRGQGRGRKEPGGEEGGRGGEGGKVGPTRSSRARRRSMRRNWWIR